MRSARGQAMVCCGQVLIAQDDGMNDPLYSSLLICKSPFKSFEKLMELMKEAFEIFNSLPEVPRGDLQGAKRVG